MSKYRILSLDGGGLRGLITVRILQKLSDDPEIKGWLDDVDLIAGTSSGGITALGLASGIPLETIGSLYLDKGPDIFNDSVWDDILDLKKLIGADYSNKVLKRELKKIFQQKKLGELNKKVAVTAFDLDNKELIDTSDPKAVRNWKPKIFHNYSGADSDKEELALNIAMYTSAAPTYFPSYKGYIDGGVFANNPSMVAYSQVISSKVPARERAKPEDVVLLSMGSGVSPKYIEGKTLDWGFSQWVKPLIQILMDGVAGISDYQCKQILGDRYHRSQINFEEGEKIELDDVDKLDEMDRIGREFIITGRLGAKEWIKKYWM